MPETPQDPNEWIRQSIIDDTQRRIRDEIQHKMQRRSCAYRETCRIAFACGIIAFGVLLFLGNLGLLPAYNLWDFWPVIPMVFGIARLSSGNPGARVFGVSVVFVCAVFLLANLGWIHLNGSWIFSIILIAVGLLTLSNVLDPVRGAAAAAVRAGHAWKVRHLHNVTTEMVLSDFTFMGSLKRRVESPNFQGGELTLVLGNIDIDLRRCVITAPENTAVINANCILGALKIRVPEHWRVHVRGISILGNFEDKTVPPNTGPNAPTLVIGGWCFMGAVEIED